MLSLATTTWTAAALPALGLAALLTASTVQARPPENDDHWRFGPPNAEMQLARLNQALDLTDEQSVQLLEVLQAAEVERADLHARIMEQMKPEVCALMQGTEAEILTILTPEQAATFAQLKEERQDHFDGRHGHGMGLPDCDEVSD